MPLSSDTWAPVLPSPLHLPSMQNLRRPLITVLINLAPSSAFLAGTGPSARRGVAAVSPAVVFGKRARLGGCSTCGTRDTTDLRTTTSSSSSSGSGRFSISRPGRRVGSNGVWAWEWGLRSSSGDNDNDNDKYSSSGEGEGEGEQSWDWRADSSGEEGDASAGRYRDTDNPWDFSSQSKWERLYAEGEKEKRSSTFLSAMADWDKGGVLGVTDVEYSMPVDVVSFDLDDTLWSTMAVINQANAALREHMSREHPALVEKFEIADLMKEVWKEKLQQDPELDPAPVNLTELRKAGLTRACELTGTDPTTVVDSCFEIWRRARHDVEPHLFPGALETLKALRERGVRLVAITNGNAQTDHIPCLKDLFEFCVLAEQVGERKPQPGPFKEAVKRAGYASENAVGGEWVHVGDDWASDCVGGKKMRMRTVLVRVPGKPAVGSAPPEDKKEEEEQEEQDDNIKNSLDGPRLNDDDDDDDAFPTLEDETLPADESPEGKAQRLQQEQEKARRKAEKLDILVDSYGDFEVDAGTAVANMNATEQDEDKSRVGDKARAAADLERQEGGGEVAEEERRREEEEAAKDRQNRIEEEEREAREELKKKKLYGQDMTAIAMGHPEAAQGPGKLMSMGSSSYVVDMLMKDFMDASLDNITEVVGLVDEWSKDSSSTSYDGEDEEAAAVMAAVEAVEAGRRRSGGGGGASRRSGDKFCIECGVKIPAAAKFCPECGAKQETLAA